MFQLRLKSLRERAGYSQAALADRLGVSQSTVGNWETGRREPGFASACAIADLFEVTVDYLIGRSDDPGTRMQPGSGASEVKRGMLQKLLRLKRLDPELYRIAVRQLEVILAVRNGEIT